MQSEYSNQGGIGKDSRQYMLIDDVDEALEAMNTNRGRKWLYFVSSVRLSNTLAKKNLMLINLIELLMALEECEISNRESK